MYAYSMLYMYIYQIHKSYRLQFSQDYTQLLYHLVIFKSFALPSECMAASISLSVLESLPVLPSPEDPCKDKHAKGLLYDMVLGVLIAKVNLHFSSHYQAILHLIYSVCTYFSLAVMVMSLTPISIIIHKVQYTYCFVKS